jgi:hypothetical protein
MAKSTKNTKQDEDYIGWGGAATVNLIPFGGFIYSAVQSDKFPNAAKSAVRIEAFKWVALAALFTVAFGTTAVAVSKQ